MQYLTDWRMTLARDTAGKAGEEIGLTSPAIFGFIRIVTKPRECCPRR
jgi:hypothetical protein